MSNESQNIEWKESWRDEYLKWICGFANAQGGELYIGKTDNGQIVGIPNAAKLMEDIPNKTRDLLGIIVDVNLQKEAGKEYLVITVEPYPYPISYKGQYHYRTGTTKQELKGAALDTFLLRKQGKHWDGVPVPNLSIEELDTNILNHFRESALKSSRLEESVLKETDNLLMDKLKLFESTYLKRAAALLFHPDPEYYVTGAYVKIGFFKNNVDLLYHDEIHHDLFTQVEKTMDLLFTKYLKAGIRYKEINRVEEFPVPKAAIREALINAIVHKDYSSGSPIQISVYPDKLMIWNSGTLPQNWTIEKFLGKHSSRPYNPNIANTFFRSGEIEAWGRGIERIFTACKETNTPEPEIIIESTGLWVNFSYKPEVIKLTMEREKGSEKGPEKGSEKGSEKSSEKSSEKIIALLNKNPKISAASIAEKIHISPRAVEKHMANLKKEGKIKRIGAAKGGHWEIVNE